MLVGAGLAGLAAGCTFSVDRVRCALLEKSSSLGGVWSHYGNAFSRVNSSEPGYKLAVKRRAPNTNHSYACEILVDMRLAIEQHDLASHTHLEAHVSRVWRDGAEWRTNGSSPSGVFAIVSAWTVLCAALRLGTPREFALPTESRFAGEVRRGLGDDGDTLKPTAPVGRKIVS